MKVIYKYPWQEGHIKQIILPPNSVLLAAQTQLKSGLEIPMLWFLHDDPRKVPPSDMRTFIMRTTGGSFKPADNEKYVGTIQIDRGTFVGHIFELT